MPIGRFSRSCRLSVKALRHYDEEGVLRPAYVDAATGYRYYARGQARDAITIGLLRELGIGLPEIRALLDADGPARLAQLEAAMARLEAELARRENAVRTIRRIVSEGALLPYEISVRREQARTVARRYTTTTSTSLVPDTTTLIYELFDELRAGGHEPLDPILCMNDDTGASEDAITVHACVGIASRTAVFPTAEIAELPGGAFAWLTHRGPYEELGLAYHALHAWAQERGHAQRGLVREIYRNDPADVGPEDLLTEVLFPIDDR